MFLINDVPPPIWFTALGILLVAIFLGLWQWFDRRSRDPHPDPKDLAFFQRQDQTRYIGVAVMVAVALFLIVGSSHALELYSTKLLALVWLIVCVLIVLLLALAVFDGIATHRYARRQHKALAQERAKLMLEALGRTGSSDSIRRTPDNKNQAREL
jgi:hypothetical protein